MRNTRSQIMLRVLCHESRRGPGVVKYLSSARKTHIRLSTPLSPYSRAIYFAPLVQRLSHLSSDIP